MSKEQLEAKRHSLAHIMAAAVQGLWPNAKFGVGPVVEDGFYYDIDLGKTTISEDDFERIEKEMAKIIKDDQAFEKTEVPIKEAIAWAKKNEQPYKEELLNDLMREGTTLASELSSSMIGLPAGISGVSPGKAEVGSVTFYKNGDFIDLCRGPHVISTGKVGPFKILRVAGAYWRGNDNNPQMQRIYGVAFSTQKELDNHLKMIEEAKRRDHRRLGQELDLFTFSDLVGSGLPLWTPRGTYMRSSLDDFVRELRSQHDYQPVAIPHITKKDLYQKSGHWDKFGQELFKVTSREGHEFAMKPMNCPHHIQIYASRQRSYRDLPIRYSETTMVYRDEQTGELGGLSRVRSITQDDAHVFARTKHIKDEVNKIWEMIDEFYRVLGMTTRIRLSLHDPSQQENYLGSNATWQDVEKQLGEVVSKKTKKYETGVGEAAFYGPKIDFMAEDAIGREHQVATIQLDFNQPENFDLVCINEKSQRERIVLIHCAIAGSLERSLAMLIEHYSGRFPVWLAPEQIRVITLNQDEDVVSLASELVNRAKDLNIQATLDDSSESVGKRIRSSEVMKVPYAVVVGPKEVKDGMLTPRVRQDLGSASKLALKIDEFLEKVASEVKTRVPKTSL